MNLLLKKKIEKSIQLDRAYEPSQSKQELPASRAKSTTKQEKSFERSCRQKIQQCKIKIVGRLDPSNSRAAKNLEPNQQLVDMVKKLKEGKPSANLPRGLQWRWKPSQVEMSELLGVTKDKLRLPRPPRPRVDEQKLPRELRRLID